MVECCHSKTRLFAGTSENLEVLRRDVGVTIFKCGQSAGKKLERMRTMKYRMYTGNSPVLETLRKSGVINPDQMKSLQAQEAEADNDEQMLDEIHDFMEHTGIEVRALTRIGEHGEEIIIPLNN